MKDGQPLDPEKIEKQDRSHDKKLKKREEKLEKEGEDERTKRLRREAEEKRKENLIIDEIFRLYEISLIRRDLVDGHNAILLEFYPRPDFKPSSKEAKILSKLAGSAWFCEEDYQLIRSEVEFIKESRPARKNKYTAAPTAAPTQGLPKYHMACCLSKS